MVGPRGNEKIFVIEDEASVRDLSVRLLTRAGYRVTAVDDGKEAWRIFKGDPDAFDLLFVDVKMPGLGGKEFGQWVHALRPRIPILFTSSLGYEQFSIEWNPETDIAFLAKPYAPEILLAKVRMLLDDKLEATSEQ